MAKFCAQTMPYRGLGSGIPRVLADKSKVDFLDDKEGNQFTAIVIRPDLSTNSVSFIAKSDDKSRGSVEETVEKSVEETVEKSVEETVETNEGIPPYHYFTACARNWFVTKRSRGDY